MPFRTISFPQLLKDHGVREDDCPVWGVRWTDAPQNATTTANNPYDTGAIEGCFATSDEAEAEYNDLLKQASNAPVVTKPQQSTKKGKTRADGAGDRQHTGPSTTVNAQEQTGPPPALPSETLLPQPELALQSVFRDPARSDGPGAGIPSHASSWELQDAPHDISALHAQMEVLAWQAPSTFSSLAGALDEVLNDRRLAPSTTTTYAPIMSGATQPVFASTPARYTTYPPRQWTATTSGWELGPYNPTPASTTPAPPPPYTHLPPYVPPSATVSSPQYTPGPFANRQQPTYASTPIPTVSTPYTPIHFGSAQHQGYAPQTSALSAIERTSNYQSGHRAYAHSTRLRVTRPATRVRARRLQPPRQPERTSEPPERRIAPVERRWDTAGLQLALH
ncbi:hypothetical protein FOMPIDRAFT_1050511 [Fomitopsis schrenkii]|uniref:Uncharacterized protein n=1 Tax=Fomitopsis schrenkii TaxID=2126942 RepID=S8FD41_FOMSC|nr:hypothetical protein FOMPIDRAFT_1050511 [Fomitopsis schrenkii]